MVPASQEREPTPTSEIFIINVDTKLNQFGHNMIAAENIGCLLELAFFCGAICVVTTGMSCPIEHSHQEDVIEMEMVLEKRIHVVGLQYLQKKLKEVKAFSNSPNAHVWDKENKTKVSR
ncbi:hypothetical protein N7471_012845 [Penicillium samsonianum]|uniref:uncharacterized protein n=1 Tax=Penicillium samsonianum TaxID=1882272 RepID=UPI0025497974|nr:uncharacterized protein N7471_012845 [Penicillium samsonianum]KAJ6125528.1 hypothetical protein N7471_012845 [Penicillium samsonianum]